MTYGTEGPNELKNALKYLNAGHPLQAEKVCVSLLEKSPDHSSDALHILALAKRAQGQLIEAKNTIESAIKVHSPSDSILNTYGLILLDLSYSLIIGQVLV